jgi:hypothetical protein
MLDEKIKVTREGVGNECIHDKLKPSRIGTQSRHIVLLESSRWNKKISRKRPIVDDVGLALSGGSPLELLLGKVGTNLQWTSFRKRLKLDTDSWRSLTLLHIAGKDRGKSLIDEECRKRRKWPVCLLKGADEGKLAYNSIGGKVWRW